MSVNVDEQFPKWRHPVLSSWRRLLEEATVISSADTDSSMDPFGNEDIAWLHSQVRSSIKQSILRILSFAFSLAQRSCTRLVWHL